MEQNFLRIIEVDSFSNKMGLEMGLAILKLAKERDQNVAIQVDRPNHTIFLFVDDNLPADNQSWLKRKANVSKRFEQSSLSIKKDLIKGNMTLKETFALENEEYIAKGGSIPIFVINVSIRLTPSSRNSK